MTAKEFLERPYYISKDLESMLGELEEIYSIAEKVTASYGRIAVSGSKDSHSMDEIAAKIDDVKTRVSEKTKELFDVRQEVMSVIEQVSNEGWQGVLKNRYLDLLPSQSIAVRRHLTRRWIDEMCHRGEQEVGRILKDASK